MANIPIYDLTDSWSGGGTFDAIKMNVTDGGSNAASKLLNLQVGGSPLFTVQKDGAVALTGAVTGATSITMNGALSGATTVGMNGALTGATDVTASGTVTADRMTITKTGLNAPAISSTGYSLTGSDATSLVDLAGTWNTSGTPTAIKLNITESSTPNSASNLLDLRRGNVSQLAVRRTGQIVGINSSLHMSHGGGSYFGVASTTTSYWMSVGSDRCVISPGSYFGFSDLTGGIDASADVRLFRDGAAGTLAQRNGTTTQAHRVYRTWTDASNYEALELAHATYSSAQYSILRTITAGSGADNINLVLSPSGTGAISAQLADGTSAGGNARGSRAVDLQLNRSTAAQVASGTNSFVAGDSSTASADRSVAIGQGCVASGNRSTAFGESTTASAAWCFTGGMTTTASAQGAIAIGYYSTASANYAVVFGSFASANKTGQVAIANGQFAAAGDAQRSSVVMRRATSDANATELFLDGSSARLTIPTNTAWHADIRIIGRQAGGSNHAIYHRKCCIERTVNATALVSTVQTIGTDIETDANWDVAITADDTNDSLKIEVTGVAATNIRWVAEVQLVEVAYA